MRSITTFQTLPIGLDSFQELSSPHLTRSPQLRPFRRERPTKKISRTAIRLPSIFHMTSRLQPKHQISSGAVLVESLIAIPLLLLLVVWILDLGRELEQSTWLAQTSYQVALRGAETVEVERVSRMEAILSRLVKLHNEDTRSSPMALLPSVTYRDLGNRMMSIGLSGAITSVWNSSPKPVKAGVETAILVAASDITEELSHFGNPATRFDCCGKPCVGAACPTLCIRCDGMGATNTQSLDSIASCGLIPQCK